MGESTVDHRNHIANRSRTALYLALPAAVVVQVLGTMASSLAIGVLVTSWSSPGLETVLITVNALLTLVVVALCAAALLADRAAARSGPARHRGWALATWALTAALLVPGLYALLWYSGIGFDLVRHAGTAVSVIGVLLAAVALVAGVVAAARTPDCPARTAVVVTAAATPAALLTPVAGVMARSDDAATVAALALVVNAATFAGAVLAVVGLAAAMVALRRDAGGAAATGMMAPGPTAGPDDPRGRRFLSYVATPLALVALALAAPALTADDDGVLSVALLVAASALAVTGIVGAVLQVRAERRNGRVRVAAGLAAFTLPLAVTLVPAAMALALLFGDEDGWAVLGALVISVPLAAVVALIGLLAAIVAASARQYPGRAAAASVLCTALVPLALVLFVPLQAVGLALASAVLAGLLLLAALVTGLVAAASGGAPHAGAPAASAGAVRQNPYL